MIFSLQCFQHLLRGINSFKVFPNYINVSGRHYAHRKGFKQTLGYLFCS